MNTALNTLAQRAQQDLAMIAYPAAPWIPARQQDGQDVLDVLVVGAGQGGITVAAQLQRERITRVMVIDAAERGAEGPWTTYARMHTLRTAKLTTGPDLGVPSLTFQAWYEAQHGAEAYAALFKILKEDWAAYLLWLRDVLDLPVRNQTRLVQIDPPVEEGGVLRAVLAGPGGEDVVFARKIVLAHGIEASGRWWMPEVIEALPEHLRAHSADPIDFTALHGRRVAVIGAGASAFDNAATALEHGATVTLLCRRPELQRIQPYKIIATPGFLGHFGDLPDADRWEMMRHLLTVREALTLETWNRATVHEGFSLMTGAPVTAAEIVDDAVLLHTPAGDLTVDFVICGTGLDMALEGRPELAAVAPHLARWQDRYQPPQPDARMGRFPYIDSGFAFTERTPGSASWVKDIHCFNLGATLSMGPSGSSISGMKYAVPRLVRAIMSDLFRADFAQHAAAITAYTTPEFPLTFARDLDKAKG